MPFFLKQQVHYYLILCLSSNKLVNDSILLPKNWTKYPLRLYIHHSCFARKCSSKTISIFFLFAWTIEHVYFSFLFTWVLNNTSTSLSFAWVFDWKCYNPFPSFPWIFHLVLGINTTTTTSFSFQLSLGIVMETNSLKRPSSELLLIELYSLKWCCWWVVAVP